MRTDLLVSPTALLVTVLLLAAAGVIGIATSALTAQPDAHGPVFTDDGYAIRGYDPVAYFTEGRPVEGRTEFQAQWNGATWRFASAAHRDRFLADPGSYAPAYGGYCAWAVAAKGELYPVDPHAWAIVDGTLYLNYSDAIQQRWEEDIQGFIRRGDRRWQEIAPPS